MPTNLWKSINYKTPVKYFINSYIREYDLSKANINALLYQGRITQEEHNAYLAMPKKEREVKIGLLIKRDHSIYKSIQDGIIEAKRRLVYTNNIEDYEIVSIKNDAVFIVGRELGETNFPPFQFNVKNIYTVYMQLQDLEIYYGDDVDPNTGLIDTVLDVKGISEENLSLHQGGMLDLICDLCYKLQREDIKSTMQFMSDMYQRFINRALPKEFYRNFDSFSGYTINTLYHSICLSEIDEEMITDVDVNRNLAIMRDMMTIVSNIYYNQTKRRA